MKIVAIYEPLLGSYVDENGKIVDNSTETQNLRKNVKKFGPNADVVIEPWTPVDQEQRSLIQRTLEKEGGNAYPPPQVFADNPDAEIIIGKFGPFGSNCMDVTKNAKIYGVMRAGMENVDVAAATARGIAVVNATGRNANAVSDYAIGMMLAECRDIARAYHNVKMGGWKAAFPNEGLMPDMFEKTVGIIGFGFIGRLVAEKLSGFHVNILVFDPFVSKDVEDQYNVKLVDLNTLFAESDFVTVHARLTEQSAKLIGKEQFDLMKPTAYFINTARAGLVDYDALAQALKDRKLMGAALDVFYEEPIAKDSPFLSLDNVTITPHLAGRTKDGAENSPRILTDRIISLIKGEGTVGVVNKEVLDTPEFKVWQAKAKADLGL